MDRTLLDVLRQVEQGKNDFSPADHTREALQAFQRTAKALDYACKKDLIKKQLPHMESLGGDLLCSQVIVIGGLTYEGEQLLREAIGQLEPVDYHLGELLGRLGDEHLDTLWAKALNRHPHDPAGALTAARSFWEATQKWILIQHGNDLHLQGDQLFKATCKVLRLDQRPPTVQQAVQDMAAMMKTVGDLRNEFGDAHGRGSAANNISESVATMCVNLAGTACLFLLQQHFAPHSPTKSENSA